MREKDQARFWSKVALPNEQGCMLWLKATDKDGYGVFGTTSGQRRAHRVSYELAYGPIPDGLVIDHVRAKGCTNTNCVAPAHLEAVTQAENVLRSRGLPAIHAAKTHCHRGHAFDEKNTYRYLRRGRPARNCRACAAARKRGKGGAPLVV